MQESRCDVPSQGALILECLNTFANGELGTEIEQLYLLCSQSISKAIGEHPFSQRS